MNQKTLIELLKEVEDYRKGNAIKHNLQDVLAVGLLTILCNGDTFVDMEDFGKVHINTLKQFLELPHGIPSHDTFEDIFCKVDPKALKRCFDTWLDEIKQKLRNTTISIDGKSIRGSKSKAKRNTHIVTAFASQKQLILGQVSTDEKSNEITAIPQLLDMLDLKSNTVTIDAMGTQTEIAAKIVEKGGHYILAVKENQKTLYDEIKLYFDTEMPAFDKSSLQLQGLYHKTVDKDHGRIETRECFICNDIAWLSVRSRWQGISGIGVIVSKRETLSTDKTVSQAPTLSYHYVIYSKESETAQSLLQSKRAHWGIENSLHWVLDVVFHEDSCRTRLENGAENLNTMRKMSLQVFKSDSSSKGSLRAKRYRASLDLFYALSLLGVKSFS